MRYFLRLPVGRIRLEAGTFTIGSAPEVDLRLEDDAVCAVHALLHVQEDTVRLEDLSGEGLLLNGARHLGSRVLDRDDRFEIGGVTLQVGPDGESENRRDAIVPAAGAARAATADVQPSQWHDNDVGDTMRPDAAERDTEPEEEVSRGDDTLVGRTIAGRYAVRGLLGEGGMGRVYAAEQESLGRMVALKVVHPHLLSDESVVQRFYTEAKAASRLNHPNSVSVIEFGRTPDKLLYLAMEFVEGLPLDEAFADGEALRPVHACDICIGVLGALGEAHALNVIHRDIKPGNIILKRLRGGNELVKVCDFGLARIVDSDTSTTSAGLVCGTPDYMSPEQGSGGTVDARSDLYALGVVLFEMLTGQVPYSGASAIGVIMGHIHEPVVDPRALASIPDDMAEVAVRAMSKKPSDRFQTAAEFSSALSEVSARLRAAADTIECPRCSARGPLGMGFCGFCGGTLESFQGPATVAPPSPVSGSRVRLMHRESRRLDELVQAAASEGRAVLLVGDVGSGKSHLAGLACDQARTDNWCVSRGRPHPSGAPVPLHAVRELAAGLLDAGTRLESLLSSEEPELTGPLARAGLRELVSVTGTLQPLAGAAVDAVAHAVAQLTRVALRRKGAQRGLLLLDDLDRCDGSTHTVVARLSKLLGAAGVALLCTQRPGGAGSPDLVLGPIEGPAALSSLRDALGGLVSSKAAASTPVLTPLYLAQLRLLAGGQWGDAALPRNTTDAIQQRLQELDVSGRRVLQAMAVLGDRMPLDALRELVSGDDLWALDSLADRSFVGVEGTEARFVTPLMRELVEANMPAQTRRDLHQRALEICSDRDAPLEVRAGHAYAAGDTEVALMLVGAMGAAARRRGDAKTACVAFRRVLSLARGEMQRTGEDSSSNTYLRAARSLGEALRRAGQLIEAQGVVTEALAVAGSRGEACARLLLERGAIDAARGLEQGARRWFGRAVFVGAGVSDEGLMGAIDLARARFLRESGAMEDAADTYREAIPRLKGDERVAAVLEYAEILLDLGDPGGAAAALEVGELAPLLASRVTGCRGRIHEVSGDSEAARGCYERALEGAELTGDWHGASRWRDALAS